MKNSIVIFLLFVCSRALAGAQTGDTVRLCQWNLQTYNAQESQERNVSIIKVLNEINPDIFVFQGILKDSTQQLLHKIVENLSFKEYSHVPQELTQHFVEYRESHVYFNANKFKWLESKSFLANRHENLLCRLYHQTTGDTFNIFAIDLHPRSAVDREMAISDIIGPLRNQYAHFLKTAVIGGMYFYSPEESAYFRLTARHNGPPFLQLTDPFGKEWQENASEYSYMYTNSTRSNGTGCDTALGNGLKYRYDYILNRSELLENYIPNSYTVFGNDGLDRRTSSITDPPNQAVSQEIAEALQCASSHLPVYADYVFGKATSLKETSPQTFHLSATPNPASAQSLITFTLLKESAVRLSIFDAAGNEVLKLFSGEGAFGENHVAWNIAELPQGVYFIRLEADGRITQVQCAVVR